MTAPAGKSDAGRFPRKRALAVSLSLGLLIWMIATFELFPVYPFVCEHGVSYCEDPGKDPQYTELVVWFARDHPKGGTLYRRFERPWWNPWQWMPILVHPRYQHPLQRAQPPRGLEHAHGSVDELPILFPRPRRGIEGPLPVVELVPGDTASPAFLESAEPAATRPMR